MRPPLAPLSSVYSVSAMPISRSTHSEPSRLPVATAISGMSPCVWSAGMCSASPVSWRGPDDLVGELAPPFPGLDHDRIAVALRYVGEREGAVEIGIGIAHRSRRRLVGQALHSRWQRVYWLSSGIDQHMRQRERAGCSARIEDRTADRSRQRLAGRKRARGQQHCERKGCAAATAGSAKNEPKPN